MKLVLDPIKKTKNIFLPGIDATSKWHKYAASGLESRTDYFLVLYMSAKACSAGQVQADAWAQNFAALNSGTNSCNQW